jgi:hypothetical protein
MAAWSASTPRPARRFSMSQPSDTTVDLDRCRHGRTAGEFCEACDVIDLRDREAAVSEEP